MEMPSGIFVGEVRSNLTSGELADLARSLEESSVLFVSTKNDSEIIRHTLRLYGTIFVAIVIIFSFLRRRFPALYNIRAWVPELQCELAQTETYGFFSWAWRTFRINDDQLLTNCGMDTLCFLRCLRLGTKLSLVGCFNAIWLIPTFYTANGLEDIGEEDRFVLMSAANLRPASPRFAAVVVAAYITVIASLYLLSKEYNWYITYRHKFLSLRIPRNFAVYVAGIPESLQSNYSLADFFQRSPWKSTVLEANIAMNIPKLEARVVRREIVLQKLEHAIAEEQFKGKIKKHRTLRIQNATHDLKTVSQSVESVQVYQEQLDALNKSISLEIGKVRNSNHRLRSNLRKQNFDSNLLRGRALTPSAEELKDEYDVEAGDRRQQMTMPPEEDDDDLFNWQYTSPQRGESVLESTPIIKDPMPENETHVPGVNFQILPLMQSADQEIEEDQQVEQNVTLPGDEEDNDRGESSLGENMHHEGHDSPNDKIGHPKMACESGHQPHPFLQLIGMGELLVLPVRDSANQPSVKSFLEEEATANAAQNIQNVSPLDEINRNEVTKIASTDVVVNDLVEKRRKYDYNEGREGESQNDSNDRTIESRSSDLPQRELISQKEISVCCTSSSSVGSIRSVGSNISKRASSSVQNIKSVPISIANSVSVENVASGVKKARDISISGTKVFRDLGVKGSKTVLDGTLKATKLSKKAAEYGLKQAHHQLTENAASLAPILRSAGEGAPRSAGFVTFKDHYTAQASLQMLQHPSSKSILVEEAPEPGEVFWRNVGLPEKARRTGGLLSCAATTTLCLFWSFPVAFISSLTEVNSLKEKLPRLGEMIDNSPSLEMILALLAPLLLLGLNEAVLPVVLKWFAQWEGHISSPRLEASLFRKLAAFQIIQTFFISTISGSLTSELANMIDNPESIVQFLAVSLPTQSSYFIQLVFVFTFFFHGLELLRVIPLGYALIRRFVGPNLTANERRRKWHFLYSLEEPPSFGHAETFSQIVLFYVVFFVYSTISPITSVFLLGCFLILEGGYRYLLIFNFSTSPDSGGRIWAGFVVLMFAGIYIGQLTLIGLLLLNQAFYSIPALVPLLIITTLFIIYVHPARMRVAKHLPAINCLEVDRDMSAEGTENYDFLRNQYLQPALKQPLLFPDASSFTSRSVIEQTNERRS